jgi:Ca2+-binding RTX toxin-like protein
MTLSINELEKLYDFSLQQMAAESYLENRFELNDETYLVNALTLGTNRPGYKVDTDLNEGWPGLTRMTVPQAIEFVSKFQVLHQWSDDPTPTGYRPGIQGGMAYPQLGDEILANTGLSATLIRRRDNPNEFTLSIRSTESRDWEDGGDAERDMFATDGLGIGLTGFALAQLDALEQYYQWLKDNDYLPVGAALNVTGYSLGGHLATVFTEIHHNDQDIEFVETVTFNGAGRGTWNGSLGTEKDFLAYYRQVFTDPSQGHLDFSKLEDGIISPILGKMVVAGLAVYSLAELEEQALVKAGEPYDSTSIYGDPRYFWAVACTMIKFGLGPQLPGSGHGTLADEKITQVFGYETIANLNFTANSQNNGTEVKVAIEDQPLIQNLGGLMGLSGDYGTGHSIVLINDSLAVQRAIRRLDGSWNLDRMVSAFPMLSNQKPTTFPVTVFSPDYEGNALENLLDSLRFAILGPEINRTPYRSGLDGFGDGPMREVFHQNIDTLIKSPVFQALASSTSDSASKVQISLSSDALATTARNDFSSYLALRNLSPVVLQATAGNQEFLNDALAKSWGDIYERWKADREVDAPESVTDTWIDDRAEFLSWKLIANASNTAANDDGVISLIDGAYLDTWSFVDIDEDLRINVVLPPQGQVDNTPKHSAYFGDELDNTFTAGNAEDHLYGGEGNDTLTGLVGDDHLEGDLGNDKLSGGNGRDTLLGQQGEDELVGGKGVDHLWGGAGFDTYKFEKGDGVDIIVDSDGHGMVIINGTPVSGGIKEGENSWVSPDGAFRFVLLAAVDGSQVLRVMPVNQPDASDVSQILIKKFRNNDLGIMLKDAPPQTIPSSSFILGDVEPTASSEDTGFDALGNIIGTSRAKPGPEVLLGSGSADVINGLFGNDTLYGKGGNDDISGDDGADLIAGGLGRDRISGGIGNDILYGDSDPATPDLQGSQGVIPNTATPPVTGATFVDSGTKWVRFQIAASLLPPVSNSNPDAVTPVLLQLSPERYGTPDLIVANVKGFGQEQGGNDIIDAGDGNDTVYGEAGDDHLLGGIGDDSLFGGAGSDLMEGGEDNDHMLGDGLVYAAFQWCVLDMLGAYRTTELIESYEREYGTDHLFGGGGNDYLFGMAGADILYGERGNDYLVGDFYENVSIPVLRLNEDGSDYIFDSTTYFEEAVLHHGNDYLDGGEGDDYLVGLAGRDELFGGDGADVLIADGNPVEVRGRYGDDYLSGDAGADFLQGSGGNDELYGGADNDELWGDEYAGTDGQALTSWGGAPVNTSQQSALLAQDRHGRDHLDGGAGNDTLTGGGFDDVLKGGDDDDLLFGDGIGVANEGEDKLYGGDGNDQLQGNGGDDFLYGEDGADRLYGGSGVDYLSAGLGDDYLEGGDDNDVMSGDGGVDTLWGNNGDDDLGGGAGDDLLMGGEGSDTLTGDTGRDYLNGGEGNDTYVLKAGDGEIVGNGFEMIDDAPGDNVLRLEGVDRAALTLRTAAAGNDLALQYSTSDGIYIKGGMQGSISSYELAGSTLSWDDLVTQLLQEAVVRTAAVSSSYVVGGRANDTLTLGSDATARGGAGNDLIALQGARNTAVFNKGDGVDTVTTTYDPLRPEDENRVRFGEGITAEDLLPALRLQGATYYLDVQVGSSSDVVAMSININNVLDNPEIGIFEFADGSILSMAELLSSKGILVNGSGTLTGTNLADRLIGGVGDDMLSGGAGADWLQGGAGNDLLQGGTGADTYFFSPGEGDDRIIDLDGNLSVMDTLFFGEGVNPENILVGQRDQDIYIRARDAFGSVLIVGQASRADLRIERFIFSDGTMWTAEDLLACAILGPIPLYMRGSEAPDSMYGDTGNDQFFAMGGNDYLFGRAGDDLLEGGAGNDNLEGELGNDLLRGDEGDDALSGQAGNDMLYGGEGNDRLLGGDDTDELWGEIGDDYLEGNAGNDFLDGGLGSDRLMAGDGDDVLLGQGGNDQLFGGSGVELLRGGDGTDHMYGDDGNDELQGEAGGDYLFGGIGDDVISGGADDDFIVGDDGNDRLYGDEGSDWLAGGLGDDLIWAGAGNDSSISGEGGNDTLWGGEGNDSGLLGGAGNDVLYGEGGNDRLTGDEDDDWLYGGDGNDNLFADWGSDHAYGGDGDDFLEGGYGTDYLFGDGGNDRLKLSPFDDANKDYLFGGVGDDFYDLQYATQTGLFEIFENVDEGVDTVMAGTDFVLAENFENLVLLRSSDIVNINGTGNRLDNTLRGNQGINILKGAAGNDIYYVGAGDSVIERSNEGTDTVHSDTDWLLGSYLENLYLTGAARSGTGNSLANQIFGNALDNTLSGGAGADRMEGHAGNDTYIVDNAGDVILEQLSQGMDTVKSSVSFLLSDDLENLILTGNSGISGTGNRLDNILTGNGGANVLAGGLGNDVYIVASKDSVVEAENAGLDTVQSSVNWVLAANIENLVLTGTSNISATGNELDNRLMGNSAANVLKGGRGNDTYVAGAGDTVTENAGEGMDTVESDVAWTLGANIENLTLTGRSAIAGTGNALANRLCGNSASNTLTGGAGNDSYLFGRGSGSDTIVDSDNSVGNVDSLLFGSGIAYDQLWFRHVGTALEISVIGTADKVSISNWYGGASNRVENLQLTDGHYLLDSQVEALVQAMATMTPPSSGQTYLSAQQHQQLDIVLATSWQTA